MFSDTLSKLKKAFYTQKPVPENPIVLLTREPLSREHFARGVRIMLERYVSSILFFITRQARFRRESAVDQIAKGLRVGLTELGRPYRINPWQHQLRGTVVVLGSSAALRIALVEKNRGHIKTLIAGPHIVASPDEEDRLIANPNIDKVIVAADWVKHWWTSFDQYLEGKINVWTPGVTDEGVKRAKNGICLVYAKNADEKIFHRAMESLWSHNMVIVVSHFGEFQKHEYRHLLKQTKFVLYMTDKEPDGHALREAWMADIPTLVCNPGSFMHNGKLWRDDNATAPDMTEECGLFFSGETDFDATLDLFLKQYDSFTPRAFALTRFTEKQAAQRLLGIISQ